MVLRTPFQNWTQLILFPGLLSLTIKRDWNLWWFPLANQTGPIAVSIREETAARPVPCGIKTLLLTALLSSAELQLHFSPSVRCAFTDRLFLHQLQKKKKSVFSFKINFNISMSVSLLVRLLLTQRSVLKGTHFAPHFYKVALHDFQFKIIHVFLTRLW